MRILGTCHGAELGAAVAIEIKGRAFAPTHDHQGHVVGLIDATTGKPCEAYRYTTFGEETLINAQGAIIQTSEVGNPWRFASKRVDPETGWVYFGRRFYDPSNGRWTTTDPLSFADGPNLYAYLHHSPLSAFDAYGFVGEAYRDGCNAATNPNYFDGISNEYSPVFGDNAGNDAWASVQWQETKENLYAAFAGCVHGCFDFLTSHAYLFQSLAFAAGCDDLECSLEEKIQIQQAFAISQSNQIAATDAFVQQTMGVDANNAIYQAFRSGTTTTLEVASLAMGGYGLAKRAVGVVKAARLGMLEAKMAKGLVKQEVKESKKLVSASNSTSSGKLPSHLTSDQLSEAGKVIDRGGLTKAGRALQKHADRSNSAFTKAKGSISQVNLQGQNILYNILTHPDQRIKSDSNLKYGDFVDIQINNGPGVRYSTTGNFIGFKDNDFKYGKFYLCNN
ncbi:rhs family protein (plasmid) [Candidatus Protochlamydia naegleriophila]|uniref:Rhs family protein n=1 Tax=Candidatus Protochlamydia naegleriophila TaxID=389348 RepID=A0A0U5JJE6_9BACT|nr:RHS repeat-associated core domain-containing protein [Candidatus Protochlamydia naegleriophila]CUI18117.1 rhs family protein [Candidatus Protochlamydia naegleriophila]